MALEQALVEQIFQEVGLGIGAVNVILENSRLNTSPTSIQPIQIAQAVTYLRRMGLVQEGTKVLLSHPNIREVKYGLDILLEMPAGGREVPVLDFRMFRLPSEGPRPEIKCELYYIQSKEHYPVVTFQPGRTHPKLRPR